MSAWKDFSFPSPVDDVLKRSDYTLDDLLDEDDVVSDTRNRKQLLVLYLARPDVVEKMLDYLVFSAPEDADPKRKFRYPAVAAELVTADVKEITDVIFDDKAKFLDRLIDFFIPDHIDEMLCPIISRIIISFLQTHTALMLDHLRTKEQFLPSLLNHLDMYAVSEFVSKLTGQDNVDVVRQCVLYLIDKGFIPLLIERFEPKYVYEHADVAATLIEAINNTGRSVSPLAQLLLSESASKRIVSVLLQPGNGSAFEAGVQVLTSLVLIIAQMDQTSDDETLPILISEILDNFASFKSVLEVGTTQGSTVPHLVTLPTLRPFGLSRCRLLELIDALISLEYDAVDSALLDLDLFTLIIDLFVQYETNNFLHKSVESIVMKILEGTNDVLIESLFVKSKFVEKIIELERVNREAEEQGKHRKSNLAYALVVLDRIDDLSHAKDLIKLQLERMGDSWSTFADTVLRPRREVEANPLGGTKPPRMDTITLGEFGQLTSSSGGFVDMTSGLDEDDDAESGSGSDDSSGEDEEDISGEENDDDEDLDIPDDTDMDSERDSHDYDLDRVEVLLSRTDIEQLLEVASS